MKIQANFIFDNVLYSFERSSELLDRNYDDEGYACFLERIPETEDALFEINILKNAEVGGELFEGGYVSIYSSSEQVMPDRIIDSEIKFN